MRILEIEIHNIRGIKDLLLTPDGNNLVIWGPNGSGKSALVDSLDFLLTGHVSRLTGKGTAGISLSKHGPHIDHKPPDASVRAKLKIDGLNDPIEISRVISKPTELNGDKDSLTKIQANLEIAARGQHVLTRREILKYITAEASTRAQEIQNLLRISDIEEIRQSFVKADNDLDKELKSAQRSLESAQTSLASLIHCASFSEETLKDCVNSNRSILGGSKLTSVDSSNIKAELSPPTAIPSEGRVNVSLFQKDAKSLELSEKVIIELVQNEKDLLISLEKLQQDISQLRSIELLNLRQLGVSLIDDTGKCPLCNSSWQPGELKKYLDLKISSAKVSVQTKEKIQLLANKIKIPINTILTTLERVKKVLTFDEASKFKEFFEGWEKSLRSCKDNLEEPIKSYTGTSALPFKDLLLPGDLNTNIVGVTATIEAKYPSTSPDQAAWDMLTRLEENVKLLERSKETVQSAAIGKDRSKILLSQFIAARDSVLTRLYESIESRFVEFYKYLHDPDEQQFIASIKPEGAGLNFEVDFYGRGSHPPHALHSEGHQDSMGLCLYLALAEKLTSNMVDLVILDDVVMSVDADHRKQLCSLLRKYFPNKQFFITTHDKTWANQLKHEGVATSKQTVEFYNWSVDAGPTVYLARDLWSKIQSDLTNHDVSAASGKLRRGAEEYFAYVCDDLQASVKYKLNGRWELGDFLPAAVNSLRRLLDKARVSARSWGNTELDDALRELDTTISSIYQRTQAEQWSINASLHYNNWSNFSDNDYRPIVEAFQDLFGLFRCSNCGSRIAITTIGVKPQAVKCSCGKINWNLIEKEK